LTLLANIHWGNCGVGKAEEHKRSNQLYEGANLFPQKKKEKERALDTINFFITRDRGKYMETRVQSFAQPHLKD
jgi:hypothetical protein